MKSACFFRRIILPGLFLVFTLVSSQTLLSAEPLIYYTLTESKAGDQSLQILLPNTIEMNASNAEERVRAVFGQVKLLRPAIYKPVSLILDGRFASTKAVQIEGIRVTGPDLDVLVAELYHTLTIHGVKIIRIPAFSPEPIRADMVRYTAMVPVIPVWEALPPNRANTGFVLVGDEAMSADVFYSRFGSGDAALSESIAKLMKDAAPNAVVSVLSKWNQLTLVDPVSPVVSLIKSEDLQIKLAAIQALMGKGSDARVLSALESVILNDPNAAAKSAAVKVLLAAGNRKYEVFALIDKLKSPNPRTVLDAINGLVQSKNAAAGSALVEVLANNSIEIREAALRGLLELKNEKALLLALDSPAVADDMKLKVAMGMTGLGNQQSVVKGLSYLVVAGQPDQVIRAAKGLGELKAKGGVDALMEVLMDPNADVRAAAIMALGDIGDPKALDALSKVAARPKSAKEGELATQAAIRILTNLQISEVVKYADHPQVSVRRFALMALSGFVSGGRNKQVLNTLSAKLSDSNLEIQRAAAYALARIQDEGVATTLLGYAKSPDAQTRAQVAVAMGWSQNPSAVATLIELLRDSNSDVKLEAAKSVMAQKAHSALEALLNIRRHKKVEVKRAVYGAIVAVALPQDAEKMLPIYSDAVYELDEQIKLYAVEGLAGIQEAQAIRALGNLAEDANESVQMAAVKALGDKKDPTASDILARALFSATSKEMKMVTLDAMATAKQGNLERPLQDFIKGETDPQLVEKANSVYDAILQ